MPIDNKEFRGLLGKQLGDLPERVLKFVLDTEGAHAADEIAAALLGIRPGGYRRLFDKDVEEILPLVKLALEHFVTQGKIASVRREELTGPVTYYGRLL
jgi:hypothetical protein